MTDLHVQLSRAKSYIWPSWLINYTIHTHKDSNRKFGPFFNFIRKFNPEDVTFYEDTVRAAGF